MPEAPKVFISYSHDSPAHKKWVANLAARLRESGVDAQLDQWDLKYGHDVTRFMEDGLSKSSRVLVVCTDNYIGKADNGEGGVGYERLIVTSELVVDQGTDKFIPIVRNVSGKQKTPKFLATRLFIDFSSDDDFEINFEALVRELHGTPALVKPPLGSNPFAQVTSNKKDAEPISNIKPLKIEEKLPIANKQEDINTNKTTSESPLKKTEVNYSQLVIDKKTPANVPKLKKKGIITAYYDVWTVVALGVGCGVIAGLLTLLTVLLPANSYLTIFSVFFLIPFLCGVFIFGIGDFFKPEMKDWQGVFFLCLLPPAIVLFIQSIILNPLTQYYYLEKIGNFSFPLLFILYIILNFIGIFSCARIKDNFFD